MIFSCSTLSLHLNFAKFQTKRNKKGKITPKYTQTERKNKLLLPDSIHSKIII